MFWTDSQQASERLTGSYVLFAGMPAYVDRIEPPDHVRIAVMPKGDRQSVLLSDDRFEKYRKLPPMGWSNVKQGKTAVFLVRRPRRSRIHGISNDGTRVLSFDASDNLQVGGWEFGDVVRDGGYILSCKGDFPSLEDVLVNIQPHSGLAISSKYAVYRSKDGLRWLYRESNKVGIFSGTDTILLLDTFKYLKEELDEAKDITVGNIKEF